MEPIAFEISDDGGVSLGVFHATNRPRLDLVQLAARSVILDKGIRSTDVNIVTTVVREFLVKELWVPEPTVDDADAGRWITADDRQRFDELITSDRVFLDVEELGAIANALVEATTKNPTGASKAS